MPISRSWVDKEVESLTGRDCVLVRFALVLAKAPYQVDETLVGEILREDEDETRLIRVLAWASFSGARRIAKRVADTVHDPFIRQNDVYAINSAKRRLNPAGSGGIEPSANSACPYRRSA